MSLSFDLIPINVRTVGQYIEINNTRAVSGSPLKPHKMLYIGQKTSAGSAAALTPKLISDKLDGDPLFGARSMLAASLRAAKAANPYTECWAIALDDNAGGTARTMTITIAGPATADGVISLYFGGKRIQISVKSGDASTAIATAINAAIQASSYYPQFPFTSSVATSVVTLTFAHKGTVPNTYDVRHSYQQTDRLPTGVTVTVAQGVAGALDPTLQTALDALGDVQYDTIYFPYNDNTSMVAMGNYLISRWGPMSQKEGHAFTAANGTLSALQSLGTGVNKYPVTIVSFGGKTAGSGSGPTPLWEDGAAVAAINAFEATNDPARPNQTLAVNGALPPSEADRFTREERDTLLNSGVSTTYVDPSGTVRIERLITTYRTNPLGITDPSYLDVTTLRTLAQLRWEVKTRIGLKYPRHKLADDGTLFDPGQAVVTPSTIKAELISLFRDWEKRGLVENFEQYKNDLIVERDAQDRNRVNARMSPDLINQFIVFAGQIQFLL